MGGHASRIHFDRDVNSGRQGEGVEDVNVVLFPFRPPVREVPELQRKVCTVERESGGGIKVLQEVSALLPVEPLPGRKRMLRWNAPTQVQTYEESVKLQVTRKHQESRSKLPCEGRHDGCKDADG